jgi:hypothetical protein
MGRRGSNDNSPSLFARSTAFCVSVSPESDEKGERELSVLAIMTLSLTRGNVT